MRAVESGDIALALLDRASKRWGGLRAMGAVRLRVWFESCSRRGQTGARAEWASFGMSRLPDVRQGGSQGRKMCTGRNRAEAYALALDVLRGLVAWGVVGAFLSALTRPLCQEVSGLEAAIIGGAVWLCSAAIGVHIAGAAYLRRVDARRRATENREPPGRHSDPARRQAARAARNTLMSMDWTFRWNLHTVVAVSVLYPVVDRGVLTGLPWPWLGDLAPWVVMLACLVFRLAGLARGQARLDAFLDRVRSKDYRVCAACLHPLQGLGDSGKCPECGASYSRTELVEVWEGLVSIGAT